MGNCRGREKIDTRCARFTQGGVAVYRGDSRIIEFIWSNGCLDFGIK